LLRAMEDAGGWLGFDAFMALALYAPGHGYYASGSRKFGHMPQSGSDFVTAPELSPHFGRALARQVGQALQATGTTEVWEFGAGSGALAAQLIESLDEAGDSGTALTRYTIVDLSSSLRERQQTRLAAYGDRVRWVQELPAQMTGVVVGNEVLDAMPVKLLARMGGVWHERGVALHADEFVFADTPTELRPPQDNVSGGLAARRNTSQPQSAKRRKPQPQCRRNAGHHATAPRGTARGRDGPTRHSINRRRGARTQGGKPHQVAAGRRYGPTRHRTNPRRRRTDGREEAGRQPASRRSHAGPAKGGVKLGMRLQGKAPRRTAKPRRRHRDGRGEAGRRPEGHDDHAGRARGSVQSREGRERKRRLDHGGAYTPEP